jgi:hypothetical protein
LRLAHLSLGFLRQFSQPFESLVQDGVLRQQAEGKAVQAEGQRRRLIGALTDLWLSA